METEEGKTHLLLEPHKCLMFSKAQLYGFKKMTILRDAFSILF